VACICLLTGMVGGVGGDVSDITDVIGISLNRLLCPHWREKFTL